MKKFLLIILILLLTGASMGAVLHFLPSDTNKVSVSSVKQNSDVISTPQISWNIPHCSISCLSEGNPTIGGSIEYILEPDVHYYLPSELTVSGADSSFSPGTGILVLSNLTNSVSVSGTLDADPFTLDAHLSNLSIEGPSPLYAGESYSFTVSADSDYNLPNTFEISGADIVSFDKSSGELLLYVYDNVEIVGIGTPDNVSASSIENGRYVVPGEYFIVDVNYYTPAEILVWFSNLNFENPNDYFGMTGILCPLIETSSSDVPCLLYVLHDDEYTNGAYFLCTPTGIIYSSKEVSKDGHIVHEGWNELVNNSFAFGSSFSTENYHISFSADSFWNGNLIMAFPASFYAEDPSIPSEQISIDPFDNNQNIDENTMLLINPNGMQQMDIWLSALAYDDGIYMLIFTNGNQQDALYAEQNDIDTYFIKMRDTIIYSTQAVYDENQNMVCDAGWQNVISVDSCFYTTFDSDVFGTVSLDPNDSAWNGILFGYIKLEEQDVGSIPGDGGDEFGDDDGDPSAGIDNENQ